VEKYDNSVSRKIYADIYIDDRNIGGILGWGEAYQLITKEEPNMKAHKEKKGFFSFLKK
jgi:hypothetical protein